MFSEWLTLIAVVSLLAGVGSAGLIALDLLVTRRQAMWIMNLVWPITALYGSLAALILYMRAGEPTGHHGDHAGHGHAPDGHDAHAHGGDEHGVGQHGGEMPAMHHAPPAGRSQWLTIALATTHCGAGCTVGDIVAEGLLHYFPLTLFGRALYGAWVVDYVFALAFGVAFQYFTIKPMRNLTPREGLVEALKADTLSLSSWQVGMYGWMAISTFVLFGRELPKDSPVFWFMMQIAMLAGFVTSYPVNWWLVRTGVKQPM